MEKYVRVMADFCADGLWNEEGMIEQEHPDLNLPDDIIQRLEAWQLWHDRDNQDYLNESERTKEFDIKAFSEEGSEIAKAIKVHLGDEWTVVYFNEYVYWKTYVDRSVYEYEV